MQNEQTPYEQKLSEIRAERKQAHFSKTLDELTNDLQWLENRRTNRQYLGNNQFVHRLEIEAIQELITEKQATYNDDDLLSDLVLGVQALNNGTEDAMNNFADMMKKKGYYK